MKWIKRSAQILRLSWMQARTVFIFAFLIAYVGPYLMQGYQVKSQFHVPLNAWGTFACTMSNTQILLMCFVGYILLISDLPFFSSRQTYEIVRSDGRSMMAARAVFVLESTALYLVMLFALFFVMSGSTDFRMDAWDKFHYSYARGMMVDDIMMDAPSGVVLQYTPIRAFLTNVLLLFVVFSIFGLGVLFFSLLLPSKKIVLIAACVLGGLDMAVDEMGLGYRTYILSPLSYTRLEILGMGAVNEYYPSMQKIIIAASVLFIGLCVLCVFFPIKHRLERQYMK